MAKLFFEDYFEDYFEDDEDGREECPECDDGIVECDCTGGMGKEFADDDCPVCDGTGEHSCPVCNGRGWIRE